MEKLSKWLMIIAAIILFCVFLFPIWNIDLQAPQYPEGLGLRIWVNQITGQKDGDLNLINNLNHYIGMKTIHPESIPELKAMPYIIVFFSLLGIVSGAVNKKQLKIIWLIMLISVLSYGIYDFYLWGYDYGHNLNSNAPIKVPGMTYQPPLIGSKQLLNMNAKSLPGVGTYIILFSVILSVTSIYIDNKKGRVSR
jgi:copper chaperone NosL